MYMYIYGYMRAEFTNFVCYRKIFIYMQNADATNFSGTASSSSHVTPLPIPPRGRGASCGQLFPILLELPIPQWASSYYVSCWDHLRKIIFIMTYNVQFAFYVQNSSIITNVG
jgi:hypothetical protein